MDTTIKIKGMTCGHCEGRVSKELSLIAGVTSVSASAERAEAIITSSAPITNEDVDRAVNRAGYTLLN
jgi:copper chaperone